jgi:hypothetical protein
MTDDGHNRSIIDAQRRRVADAIGRSRELLIHSKEFMKAIQALLDEMSPRLVTTSRYQHSWYDRGRDEQLPRRP